MSRLAPGTPTPDALAYTAEQLATLETMKDPAFSLGIAREEFVNAILCPDGSVSRDTAAMVSAAKEKVGALIAEGSAASLAAASLAASKVAEIEEHLAQERFLFVVDAELEPLIYFQAAAAHNPDLPPLAEEAPDA